MQKRRWSGEISEIKQNNVASDVIDQNETWYQKNVLPESSSGHVEHLYPHKYLVKSSQVVQKGDGVVRLVK